MKKEGLIFANARAKCKENNLMSEERLHRIIEAKTLEDGLRVLSEMNYAGGIDGDFYTLLREEERIVTAFVAEAAPKNMGFECFFMKNDYHNVKVLLKAKYGKIGDISDMIMPDGNMTFAEIKKRTEENGEIDPFLTEAIKRIQLAFDTGVGSPRLIDTEIDKAMFKNIKSRLPSCDGCIREYFTAYVDLTNIESYFRTSRIHAGFGFFAATFLEGGRFSEKDFAECGFEQSKIEKLLASSPYKSFADKAKTEELCVYETARDNYLLKIISGDKADMFGIAPILGYYLAKLNEISVLRVVLVCLKNKVPTEEMKKRVRALYA